MRSPKCKRNQGGGGAGGGWGFSSSVPDYLKLVNNGGVETQTGNCRGGADVVRPGYLAAGYTGPKGLPGMSGGKRSGKRSDKRKAQKKTQKKSKKAQKKSQKKAMKKTRKQSGGRYGFDPHAAPLGGTPWASGYSPVSSIGCEASRSVVPDSSASNTLNKVGGPLWDGPKVGGGAESAAPFEILKTAGYTQLSGPDSAINTSAGTKLMINYPADARIMNPACLKTGGSRKSKKNSKKTLKARKGSKAAKKH